MCGGGARVWGGGWGCVCVSVCVCIVGVRVGGCMGVGGVRVCMFVCVWGGGGVRVCVCEWGGGGARTPLAPASQDPS